MGYTSVSLTESLKVTELFTIHYFEYMSNFAFPGESHDFWEFVCVDKGEVQIVAGDTSHILKKGEIAFHKPNEFHTVRATGAIAPNLIVISFACSGKIMEFFQDKILHVDELERNLLANLIIEARLGFKGRLDDPYQTEMFPRQDAPFGYTQMIRLYLEHFLIHMYRRYTSGLYPQSIKSPVKAMKHKNDLDIFNRVVDYLNKNIAKRLTIEQICHDNLIGRSQLQKIFRDKSGLGIIEYFSKLKIDTAKTMIRTEQLNFTQISEQLGYASIHYFSRQFKKITGMTPSEYASSIKAMADGSF